MFGGGTTALWARFLLAIRTKPVRSRTNKITAAPAAPTSNQTSLFLDRAKGLVSFKYAKKYLICHHLSNKSLPRLTRYEFIAACIDLKFIISINGIKDVSSNLIISIIFVVFDDLQEHISGQNCFLRR